MLIYLFIFLPYMFQESMHPSSGENYCIYATPALVTVWVASGLLVGLVEFQSNQLTRRHPYGVMSASVA